MAGVLMGGSSFAEDEFYDDAPSTKKKSKKKKKKKKKKKSKKKEKKQEEDEEDYWSDSEWGDENESAEVKDNDDDDAEDSDDGDSAFEKQNLTPTPPKPPAASSTVTKTALGRSLNTSPPPAPKPAAPAPAPKLDPRTDCINRLLHNPGSIQHQEITVRQKHWTAPCRINMQHKVLVRCRGRRDAATIHVFNDRELRVKWDAWDENVFIRQSDGQYVQDIIFQQEQAQRLNDQMNRRAQRVAKRLCSRRAISWEDYGWSGKIMDYVLGNDTPLVYRELVLRNEDGRFKVRFSEEEKVLVKMRDNHEAATVLDYTGVKLHVRWPNGRVETYRRREDNVYRQTDDVETALKLRDSEVATREKSEDDWFQIWWRDVMDEEKPLTYVNIKLQIGKEECEPRICMDNRLLVLMPPHKDWAKVIKYDRHELHIRWNNEREEIFKRGDGGVFFPAR